MYEDLLEINARPEPFEYYTAAELWTRFTEAMPDFQDFQAPGATLTDNELSYKRKVLARFKSEAGREKLQQMIDEGNGSQARKELAKRIGSNMVAFRAWPFTFGDTDEDCVALLSALLTGEETRLDELDTVPSAVTQTLQYSEQIAQHAQRYRYMNRSVIIGRGYNLATSFELALKMKELTYTLVEPYSSADFLHGPMAMIEEGFPVLVIAPAGVMLPEMDSFVATLKERGAEVLIISDDDALLGKARTPLPLAQSVPEWLSPITAIVPGQLFAMHLAHTRDYDVDAPRGLRKVTETR